MMEKWLPVKGYEDYYEVSDMGNVRSVDRTAICSDGRPLSTKGRILAFGLHPRGYLMVNLSKGGKAKIHLVHRLVAEAFIPNPQSKEEVNHKYGVKADNRASHLEWVTPSENLKHAYAQKLISKQRVNKIVLLDYKTGVYYFNIREAARSIGVNHETFRGWVTGIAKFNKSSIRIV